MRVLRDQGTEVRRSRVLQAIRESWVRPRIEEERCHLPPDQVEDTARAVLDAMLTRPFRVGSLPPPEVQEQLLERVRRRVRRGQPVYVTQGYAPLKNLNVVERSRADWAEFFALSHLAAWHNKVQTIYPPGLRVRIAFDDATLAMANRADRRVMDSYITSIRQLIPRMGLDRLIIGTLRHSSFAWLFHFGLYQLAAYRVWRWERDPANRAQLERMAEYARRNVVLPPDLPADRHEHYWERASHRYRVYWEALQLSGLTWSKNRIIAMYLDGGQHHLRQPVALHLTSVAKGQVTQPWQGEGALLDNGHGKLVPFVLTAARRRSRLLEWVDGLDVLNMPGFDRILVATDVPEQMAAPAGENT